jgi:hypothetical protein
MGDVPEEECARVEEHLLICEACRERVTASDIYVLSMRDAARQLRSEPLVERQTGWWRPRLVPALLAAGLLAFVVWQAGRDVDRQPRVFAVSLAALRGSNPPGPAPSGTPLDLRLDLNALPPFDSYGVEVVDRVGNRVWQGATAASGTACRIAGLPAGAYFVRVSSPSGELLREYALETAGR